MSKSYKPAKTAQLEKWTSDFGDAYAERNAFEEWRMVPGTEAFRRMMSGREVDSVLEVGCNVGLNLIFINALFNGRVKLYGVEPNPKAYQTLLRQPQITLAGAWNCDAFSLPMADASVDLAFTAGVLIHIAPADLEQATDEIVRVAKKYVLCAEYFSHTPVEAPYRNHTGLLFKRDFGAFYLDRYAQLRCIDYGFLWQREYASWGNVNWWLFEKKIRRQRGIPPAKFLRGQCRASEGSSPAYLAKHRGQSAGADGRDPSVARGKAQSADHHRKRSGRQLASL